MVLTSKEKATDEKGNIKEGFYMSITKNNRILYFEGYRREKKNKKAVKKPKIKIIKNPEKIYFD